MHFQLVLFNQDKVTVTAFKWFFFSVSFQIASNNLVNVFPQNVYHQITCLNLCVFTLVTLSLQSGDQAPELRAGAQIARAPIAGAPIDWSSHGRHGRHGHHGHHDHLIFQVARVGQLSQFLWCFTLHGGQLSKSKFSRGSRGRVEEKIIVKIMSYRECCQEEEAGGQAQGKK